MKVFVILILIMALIAIVYSISNAIITKKKNDATSKMNEKLFMAKMMKSENVNMSVEDDESIKTSYDSQPTMKTSGTHYSTPQEVKYTPETIHRTSMAHVLYDDSDDVPVDPEHMKSLKDFFQKED